MFVGNRSSSTIDHKTGDDVASPLVKRLGALVAKRMPGGYHPGGPVASEPTALAGLALAREGRLEEAKAAGDWLARLQTSAGSVGVTESQPTPCWATGLAILLWQTLDANSERPSYREPIERAVRFALADHGKPLPQHWHFAHDTTLIGWSWAANTHSWLEPTAMFVLALRAVGQSQHDRTREAVRLLIDRLLPEGGANYGNTVVLGNTLLPHVQPTGLVLWALANEPHDDPRIERSLAYLERVLPQTSATASLCYGLIGLTAHGRRPRDADQWLIEAYRRTTKSDSSLYKLALISLASHAEPLDRPNYPVES